MNKTKLFAFAVLLSLTLGVWGVVSLAAPQSTTPGRPEGNLITPPSSVERPEDAGVRAHTNYKIFVPAGSQESFATPDGGTFTCQLAAPFCETPASIGCVYNVGPTYAGCNPGTGGTNHPSGGWGAIALVDAYDDPNAASDLAFFDSFFGLPTATFTKVYATSSFGTLNGLTASCSVTPPSGTTGWDIEESLDIEWAHVMAPSAQIILVEACSSGLSDLVFAEEVAGKEVEAAGGGDISNSWGTGDFSGENTWDKYFYSYYFTHLSYFASAGDTGAEIFYPSASPWVVSAGGTVINRNSSGNYSSESCWPDSGGGFSAYEKWQNPPTISNGLGPWADFQYIVYGGAPFAYPFRSTPDIAFDAGSPVLIYDTYEGGQWYTVTGTSVSSPSLAGIVNASNLRLGQTLPGGGYYKTRENDLLYAGYEDHLNYPNYFYDVTTGSNGHAAGPNYDQCTGIGTPRGHIGK
jgi:kumamolisin